jgi:hypothetical protein
MVCRTHARHRTVAAAAVMAMGHLVSVEHRKMDITARTNTRQLPDGHRSPGLCRAR